MSDTDRSTAALAYLVRKWIGHFLSGPVDYHAPWRGRIVAQSADRARVDVVLDDARIGNPSNIPLKLGLPGTTVQVNGGDYCVVGFEGGDPLKPYAMIWEQGGPTPVRVDINATTIDLNNGTNGAVRKGDTLNASSQMATWAGLVETAINGLVPGTFTPANQFTGITPANPGNTGQFGETWGASGSVKIGD